MSRPIGTRAAADVKKPVKDSAERVAGQSRQYDADVTVVNKRGLHARAAAKFVKLAGQYECEVKVTTVKGGLAAGSVVSGRSIMGLMMLAAAPGCVLHIEAEGSDAAAALTALVSLVEDGFEEED